MKKVFFSGLLILAVMLLMPLAVLERPEQVSAWTGDYTEIPARGVRQFQDTRHDKRRGM